MGGEPVGGQPVGGQSAIGGVPGDMNCADVDNDCTVSTMVFRKVGFEIGSGIPLGVIRDRIRDSARQVSRSDPGFRNAGF